MKNSSVIEKKADVFKALGHPIRILIVEKLLKEQRCVCDLVAMFSVSQATVSRHLDILGRAGLVSRRGSGVRMMYKMEMTSLSRIISCLEEETD